MKQINLFLLKFLGYSLVLFIFGRPLVDGYSAVLSFIIQFVNPQYPLSPYIGKFTYITSLTIIAFLAIILATPKIAPGKKAGFFFIGMAIFLLTDFFGIQYLIFPQGQFKTDVNSGVRHLYLYSKWFVPFAIWIMMSYPQLGELFKASMKYAPQQYVCPICEENHADVMGHICAVHGEESLKINKVKMFIAENPQVTLKD